MRSVSLCVCFFFSIMFHCTGANEESVAIYIGPGLRFYQASLVQRCKGAEGVAMCGDYTVMGHLSKCTLSSLGCSTQRPRNQL